MTEQPIYLDYHATTPCDPRVVEAMLPTFTGTFGNAASRHHRFGSAARELVERARELVAALIGCRPAEIVFTSGATESDNLAVKGASLSPVSRGRHVVTSAIEHRAVLDPCERLERSGFEITHVRPGADGRVRPADVEAAIRDDTTLVSIMYANNEIGTVNPIGEIGAICRARGVIFHCDAVQALPYLPCDVDELCVDLLSISAHKMYGPKGAGALFVRRRSPRVRLEPLIDGGGHERGMRSGTINVSGIVGLGCACDLARSEREDDSRRVGALRDRLLAMITEAVPDAMVNGSLEHRLPNNINVSFPGIDAADVIERLETVAVSSGAACSSASSDGSYVIRAIGGDADRAGGSIRISLGRFTSDDEIETAGPRIVDAVRRTSPRRCRP